MVQYNFYDNKTILQTTKSNGKSTEKCPSFCKFDAIFAEKVPGKSLFARVREQDYVQKSDLTIPDSPLKLQLPVSSALRAMMILSEVLFHFHTCV